ncbi:alpha/beta hydrolase [Aspergillus thermomutatus]|uniref:Alpha/beta hydrolase fold-3 domain-containing protein n=1 Tax=Aspergillus thermomutatus TaxID=41047 RepID=A0A397GJ47_ASPTH|nr:uncharacterized protein CDV56_105593 [Aspergillus thermomutatus]RHZ50517.1 hypothetical protein CDV56_105593 [Aspergillus thermomutatus]
MKSDVCLDASKFAPNAISGSRLEYLHQLHESSKGKPALSKETIPAFREASEKAAVNLPGGEDILIPSRDLERQIPCRAFRNTKSPAKGVLLHIHGGGYSLNTEKTSDPTLQRYVQLTDYTIISVGYRRAPEHVFPAALEDCCDVAVYLVRHAQQQFGAPFFVIAGDSVGGGLTLQTTFHLLRKFRDFYLKALVLFFGDFAPSGLPAVQHVQQPHMVDAQTRERYTSYYLPGRSTMDLQRPDVAPFYVNLEEFRGRLPPALFLSGTVETLVDDSIMMCVKWLQAGGSGILKLVPGGFHRFMALPLEVEVAREGWSHVAEFLIEVL